MSRSPVTTVTPRWLSIPGAMRYTGFSESAIRKAIEAEKFPAHRVEISGPGRKANIRIDRHDLDAWIASTSSPASPTHHQP